MVKFIHKNTDNTNITTNVLSSKHTCCSPILSHSWAGHTHTHIYMCVSCLGKSAAEIGFNYAVGEIDWNSG